MASKYVLKLYIMGNTKNSVLAIKNLRKILDEELKNIYKLVIIDLERKPALAEKEKILAIPTLEKTFPKPVRRIIGDLSDKEKLLNALDLKNVEKNNEK